MFYHWTIFALDAEERVALSSPAYETGILLLNYSAMVVRGGLEPPTFGLSYHYNFHYHLINVCGLEYTFTITGVTHLLSTEFYISINSLGISLCYHLAFTDTARIQQEVLFFRNLSLNIPFPKRQIIWLS